MMATGPNSCSVSIACDFALNGAQRFVEILVESRQDSLRFVEIRTSLNEQRQGELLSEGCPLQAGSTGG